MPAHHTCLQAGASAVGASAGAWCCLESCVAARLSSTSIAAESSVTACLQAIPASTGLGNVTCGLCGPHRRPGAAAATPQHADALSAPCALNGAGSLRHNFLHGMDGAIACRWAAMLSAAAPGLCIAISLVLCMHGKSGGEPAGAAHCTRHAIKRLFHACLEKRPWCQGLGASLNPPAGDQPPPPL